MQLLNLKKTCDAFPAQWEAQLEDGRHVYIRYRGHVFGVGVGDTPDMAVSNAIGEIGKPCLLVDLSLSLESPGQMTCAEMLKIVARIDVADENGVEGTLLPEASEDKPEWEWVDVNNEVLVVGLRHWMLTQLRDGEVFVGEYTQMGDPLEWSETHATREDAKAAAEARSQTPFDGEDLSGGFVEGLALDDELSFGDDVWQVVRVEHYPNRTILELVKLVDDGVVVEEDDKAPERVSPTRVLAEDIDPAVAAPDKEPDIKEGLADDHKW